MLMISAVSNRFFKRSMLANFLAREIPGFFVFVENDAGRQQPCADVDPFDGDADLCGFILERFFKELGGDL